MTVITDNANSFPTIGKSKKLLELIKYVQDYCFITLDAPSSVYVCGIFWTICFVNKPLFFPAEMEAWVPDWYNHAVHTMPAPLIILQMFLYPHHNPPITRVIIGLVAHCLMYTLCILHAKWKTGQWIYLVIGEMAHSIVELITFFLIVGFIVPVLILLACYKINGYARGLEGQEDLITRQDRCRKNYKQY